MPMIGSHEYETTSALVPDTGTVGTHAYTSSDNTNSPCNGLDTCSGCPDDADAPADA